MEKIGCSKYGNSIEIPVAAGYLKEDAECLTCSYFVLCSEEKKGGNSTEGNEKTSNPGSDEAIKQGCTCGAIENKHGKGFTAIGGPPIFFKNPYCKIHGADAECLNEEKGNGEQS